jgi:hypothetical protein
MNDGPVWLGSRLKAAGSAEVGANEEARGGLPSADAKRISSALRQGRGAWSSCDAWVAMSSVSSAS